MGLFVHMGVMDHFVVIICELCRGDQRTFLSTDHGYQIWPQSGSDWPQMGQIREIFRSDSVHFGALRQNVLNLI